MGNGGCGKRICVVREGWSCNVAEGRGKCTREFGYEVLLLKGCCG